jgi:NAD(P)-dependent dehydrogenase (short-subunit alcohol dehydrogenase family)
MEKRVTVISGGSGGIGRSVVRRFLETDIVVVLDVNTISDEKILDNPNFWFIKTDVTDPDDIQKAKNEIQEKYGKIKNLISMAGINMVSEIGGIKEMTIEDIDKSVKLNLNSHIYLTKIFLDILEIDEDVKNVIMISSINAIADYGLPAYSAAKAGIYGFMKAVVNELGRYNVRINTISLGTVPHKKDIVDGVEYYESKRNTLTLREFLKPKDVAETLYALIYVTRGIVGQNIVLDMGQSV